jgi:hypothetical protein
VTNGCDHAIELVLDDTNVALDDLETLALYVDNYEPGQTRTTSAVGGIDEVRLVGGVTRKEPTVVATIQVSATNPAPSYTVSGDECEPARP